MGGRPTPQPEENRDSGILSKDELNALFGGEVNAIPMPDESNRKKPPSDEILSKEEVENLLNMMGGTPPSPPPLPPPQLAWTSNTNEENPLPERIDKAQLKQLQLMHEKLALKLAAKISAMLQCITKKW